MRSATAADFLQRLSDCPGRRKRLDAEQYRRIFVELCPALPVPDARAKLSGWLNQLAENDDIRMPKGQRLYDRSSSGDLPAWIELMRPDTANTPLAINPETYAWAEELRFACAVRDARQIDMLLRVQRFLANGGRQRPLVPVKERSIELFGHEKRLEMVKTGSLFEAGKLSLQLLRCFSVPPPLIHESALPLSGLGPALIIENHSTYHSFVRWNGETRVFCAVIYGQGDAFKTSAAGLAGLVGQWAWDGRLLYFGDLDPEGLLIPLAASSLLSAMELPLVSPHLGCYRRLLQRARTVQLPSTDELHLPTACGQWLGPEIATETAAWFKSGTRLAQELVGWETLKMDGLSGT